MDLMHYFVNGVIKKCWNGNNESSDYKVCLEQFIEDILKVIFIPEFPFAHKFLHYIVVQFFIILNKKTHSAIIRQFAIDKISVISRELTRAIKEVRTQPVTLNRRRKQSKRVSDDMEQCSSCLSWFDPGSLDETVCDICLIQRSGVKPAEAA